MKTLIIFLILLVIAGVVYYFGFYKKTGEIIRDPATTSLLIEVLKEGSGKEAENGDTVFVHYTGTLENGTKFDSSLDKGVPFSFVLGSGQVIAGWDQGLLGMKIGEKRRLTIAPELAYGSRSIGNKIPANSTLIFEVELLDIR